jgi:hypothetical protein
MIRAAIRDMLELVRTVFLCLICLSPAVPAFAQSSDIATLKGEFLSMVALPDNNVLLLSKNRQLVKVSKEGEISTMSLPALPGDATEGILKDFTVRGSTLTFCFFDLPLLLSIDLPKLDSWKRIELKGITGKPQFARIEAWDDSFHLMAANGKWYSVDAFGNVKELAKNSLLLSDSAQSSFTIQAESDPKDGLKTWKILRADGTWFLVRKSASKAEYMQTFLPVGFDSQDNFIFLEGTGPGPFRRSLALYAAKDGKIVASAKIGKVGVPSFLKSHVVLSDGSVGFLALGKEPKSLVLKKITLE